MSSLPCLDINSYNYANDVSADGSVIVGRNYNGINQACSWKNGVMTTLGDLPGGSVFSAANAVSADGKVIAGKSVSSKGIEACRWKNGVMTGLGDLAGGRYSSEALDI